jgi:hypothetical protein
MSLTLLEASLQNPHLARLQTLMRESSRYLALVQPLLPPTLRNSTKAGPIDTLAGTADGEPSGRTVWCLIAANNASASKLRQLLPTLLKHLQGAGHPVSSIRLTIEKSG